KSISPRIETGEPTAPPADTAPTAENVESPHEAARLPSLRLWPAVAILVAMWLLALVPGWVVPLTLVHFITMQFAPVLGLVLLLIWWMLSKAVPMRQRLVGLALVSAVCAVAI